jgi:uncharacterized protein
MRELIELCLCKNINMIKKSTILKIIYEIATATQPDKIYLIGSYATGQANENSDIDLLVIKDTIEPRYKRSIEFQKVLIGTKIPADIIVYTNDEFEKEKSKSFSFISKAIIGAQLIYERKH